MRNQTEDFAKDYDLFFFQFSVMHNTVLPCGEILVLTWNSGAIY